MCGGGPWNVHDTVFQLMEFHGGNIAIGGPVVPVVPVVCGNCGHTVLVNAITSGGSGTTLPNWRGLQVTEQGKFQVSQGFDVLPPRSGNAYPIPCEEWKALKSKISKITSEPWFFHTIGSLLLGVALSSFVTILLETFSAPDPMLFA